MRDEKGEVSFLRIHIQGEIKCLTDFELRPWRYLDKELEHFAGQGTYLGYVDINETAAQEHRYILSLGNVSDTFRVWVNDCPARFPDQVMKRVDITELLHKGRNRRKVVVSSNLYNRIFTEDIGSELTGLTYLPRDYGIWESEHKRSG